MITAVPTTYAGVEFRSRLESRWAAFFDLCGWEWRYESDLFPRWLVDFTIFVERVEILVEVKPIAWLGSEADWFAELDHPKIRKIRSTPRLTLALGNYPISGWNSDHGNPAIGVFQRRDENPSRRAAHLRRQYRGEIDLFEAGRLVDEECCLAVSGGTIHYAWAETLSMTRKGNPYGSNRLGLLEERRKFIGLR